MASTEENIRVVFNSMGGILLVVGDNGIALEREEAEKLFVDLGHALQDQDVMMKVDKDE